MEQEIKLETPGLWRKKEEFYRTLSPEDLMEQRTRIEGKIKEQQSFKRRGGPIDNVIFDWVIELLNEELQFVNDLIYDCYLELYNN